MNQRRPIYPWLPVLTGLTIAISSTYYSADAQQAHPTTAQPVAPATMIATAPDQQLPPTLTLQAAVDFALQHSPALKGLQANLASIDLRAHNARQAFMPSVSASIGENASFGRSQGVDGVYREVSSANTSFQIGASWEVYSGGRRLWDLRRSQEELKARGYVIANTKDGIALQTIEAYVSVLLAQQMAEMAEHNLALSTALLEQTKVQVSLGKLPRSQQIQMESQCGQDRLSLAEAKADVRQAIQMLLLQMGVLPENISTDYLAELPTIEPEEIAQHIDAYIITLPTDGAWTTPATELALMETRLAHIDTQAARTALLPSLSLSAGYSNGYYYTFGEGIKKEMNPSFGDQIKQNGRTFVGVSLNIPIYNRGQVRSAIRQAKIQELMQQSNLISRRYEDARNITIATSERDKATEQYRISTENVRLAEESLKISEQEYTTGRITAIEWDQTRNKYLTAKSNYLRSVYNRLLRTINLAYYRSGALPLHLTESNQ